jgi:hypothetical protein
MESKTAVGGIAVSEPDREPSGPVHDPPSGPKLTANDHEKPGNYSRSGTGNRIVTNSSAELGWIPIVESKSRFVAPHLIAIANP